MTTYGIHWKGEDGWYFVVMDSSPEPNEFAQTWRDSDYYGPFDTQTECQFQLFEEMTK